MELDEIKTKLQSATLLLPLEQEEFLDNLAKETGKKKTRLKEQLDLFIKDKRKAEEIGKNCNDNPIENFSRKLGNMFDKRELADRILDMQPCYYDNARNWWLWNWQKFKWQRVDETDILNAIEKQATVNTINSKEKNEMLEALKQQSRKNAPIPIKPTWIQFKDTIYDIMNGEQFKATPDYFVTNPIPHELHPENFVLTPTIDRIFTEWVGEEYVQTLYEIIAYSMLPDYPLHRLFCFIGAGMNGKSKFLELLRKFIGEENCCATELDILLQSRFEITRLHKKLICQMGETNFNEMNKTSQLKKLTGGDLIGFEYKNRDTFEDKNYAKIIIATNSLPTTTDKTIGFYRRWLIIDFPNQFSEAKDILKEVPEEEYQSLSLKCCMLLKDLLEQRKFTNEGNVEERMKKYEERSNPLEKFWKDCIKEDYDNNITKAEFKRKLDEWCKENRFRELSDRTIAHFMSDKNIEGKQVQAEWFTAEGKKPIIRVWVGIKWQ